MIHSETNRACAEKKRKENEKKRNVLIQSSTALTLIVLMQARTGKKFSFLSYVPLTCD